MAGLLSGLSKLGLGKLENADLFAAAEDAPVKEEKPKEPIKIEYKEEDFLFDKTYECPVCYKKFKAKTIRAGRVHMTRSDKDLRPIYDKIEPLKYDVVLCPHCGYAALTRYFGGLTAGQIKAVREGISSSFQAPAGNGDIYSYEEALDRYKLCLANAIVKRGKSSEKAYICLKAGWLLRSMSENFDKEDAKYEAKCAEAKEQEQEFLKHALEGFITAKQTETFPICGMDEYTFEYLLAVLSMKFEQYEMTAKLISNILTSASASKRIKDKARDMKEELLAAVKKKKAESHE